MRTDGRTTNFSPGCQVWMLEVSARLRWSQAINGFIELVKDSV